MAKASTSQWDFGDLFTWAESRRVYTVGELTREIRQLLEGRMGQLRVTGEITNLRVQRSGHIYFTLKDSDAQLNCVLFRGEAIAERELVKDGQKVTLLGDLTVYEPRGQYQVRVRGVELQGIGALQQAFERLKRKLNAEGLFASDQKRPLPKYPQRIGLVTSPTGAAIRDILHVVERRQPGLEIILVPCRVQGQGAAEELAEAIRLLNRWSNGELPAPELQTDRDTPPPRPVPPATRQLDLILVTRGGGSLEDLWAFNEEVLARTIFQSALPVVSAVGHEIDFTISDFAADLRAPTPSAAAEVITEGMFSCREFVAKAVHRLRDRIRQRLAQERRDLKQLEERLRRAHPRRRLERHLQQLDDLQEDLTRQVRRHYRDWQRHAETLYKRLLRVQPRLVLARRRERLDRARQTLLQQAQQSVHQDRRRLQEATTRLRLLSPENVLQRGYSITLDAQSGGVIRSAEEVAHGQHLKTRLKTGEIDSRAEKPEKPEK